MALQLILGNSGGGKTHYLYTTIIEDAVKHPEKNYLILVPEQFTMETQRDLVTMHPGHSISNIDVLSFGRLSYRVLEELGGKTQVVLEDTGKSFLLRKIAEDKKEQLLVLKGNLRKLGYIDEMKSFLSELMQYQVKPQQLLEMGEKAGQENLRRKLGDVYEIYSAFMERTGDSYITAEEILEVVAQKVGDSEWLKDSVIAFDGFTGFTPIQNRLLEELMKRASRIYATVTIDSREDAFTEGSMQELFYMSKKYVCTLVKLAENAGIDIEEPVVLDGGAGYRYQNAPALYALEQNLFRKKSVPYEKECNEILLYSLANPKEELEFAAAEMKRLVQEEGYRYKDMAVVCGDVEGYGNYVNQIFGKYEIPVFVDQTKNIIFHPFIECIRGILNLIIEDFSCNSVMDYLRCGLSELPMEQVDILENYLLATGIGSFSQWKKKWVRNPLGMKEEELQQLNEIRAKLVEDICEVRTVFLNKQSDISEQTMAIYKFLTGIHAGEKLKEEEKSFETRGDFVRAKENSQIYRIVMELFEKLVELLGDEIVSAKEYKELLDAGFSSAEVAVIPQGNDCVVVGDIERTRLNHIRILFFVGVNDGLIPSIGGSGGILSELERQTLLELDAPLAFGARERALVQRFYLYLNMTKPQEKLYLTYARTNEEGKALRRSFLVGTIQKLFPKLKVNCLQEEEKKTFYTPRAALDWFTGELRSGAQGEEIPEDWYTLFSWYLQQEEWKEKVMPIVDAAFLCNREKSIGAERAKGIYGEKLENSISRLERFEACAFSHFLTFGLGLKERRLHEFQPVDMGNVFHSAMDFYTKSIQQQGLRFAEVPEEQMETLSEQAMEAALMANDQDALFSTARTAYLANRMKRVFKRTVSTVTKQIGKGTFEPVFHEMPFYMDLNLEEADAIMNLRGRIDRVDVADVGNKKAVRIVDYKSSMKDLDLSEFYNGLSLQLPVYMNAAIKQLQKKYPGEDVIPAGVFYYGMTDPIINVDKYTSHEEAGERIEGELRMKGYVNEDKAVIEQMDDVQKGSSSVIPISVNADGSCSKTSKTLTTEEFHMMLNYADKKVKTVGTEMMQGAVQIEPYRKADRTGCDFCPFSSVCGFDTRLSGYQYKELEELNKQEIFEKINENLTNVGLEDEKGGE